MVGAEGFELSTYGTQSRLFGGEVPQLLQSTVQFLLSRLFGGDGCSLRGRGARPLLSRLYGGEARDDLSEKDMMIFSKSAINPLISREFKITPKKMVKKDTLKGSSRGKLYAVLDFHNPEVAPIL